MNDTTISVSDFERAATAWLNEHRDDAPPDYGAILPPPLVARGIAWQRLLFTDGWAGIDWPIEFGGRGLTPEHRGAWVRACALAGVPPFLNMVGMVLAGGSTLLFGTEAQKQEHLLATLRADRVWCQLFSEPDAGSDLGSLRTTALRSDETREGDNLIVNGQKVWCSGGRYSDWGILLARTDTSAPKHKGISFFLVDMHSPGLTVRPLRQMTGEAEFDEVLFDNVTVPIGNLLGPLHGGWGVAMATLTNERGSIGTAAISLGRRLDTVARQRDAAAGGIGAVERARLIDVVARGRALAALGGRQGPVASTAASLLKLGITELSFDTANVRADLGGAASMLVDREATQALVAAPGGRIAGGTSQIQRNLIGERLLGLPAEPRFTVTPSTGPDHSTS